MREQSQAARHEQESRILKSNVTGAFGAASAIAALAGQRDAAQKFAKLEKFSGALYDIAKSDQTFSNAPFAVVNPYLLAAVMAVDLVSSSSKEDPNAAIVGLLLEIQRELRELRQLISTRFDRIEFKIDTHFAEVESTLDTIRSEQQVAVRQLEAIRTQLGRIEESQSKAWATLGRFNLLWLNTQCFPGEAKISVETYRYCWNAYLYLAAGKFDMFLSANSNSAQPPQLLRSKEGEFKLLQNLAVSFGEVYPTEQTTGYLLDPTPFSLGVYYLQKLQALNPTLASGRVSLVMTPGERVEVGSVVDLARQVQSLLQSAVVAEDGALRRELIYYLFDQYQKSVLDIWDVTSRIWEAKRIDARFGGLLYVKWPKGPNVLDFEAEAPLINSKLYAQREYQEVLHTDPPTGPASWMTLCPGSQIFFSTYDSADKLRPLRIDQVTFRFPPAIFNRLPAVIRWALLDGVMSARIYRCMSKFAAKDIVLGQGDAPRGKCRFGDGCQWEQLRAIGEFELRWVFAYRDNRGEHEIQLPPLTATYRFTRRDFACKRQSNYEAITMAIWNGGGTRACDESGQRIFGAAEPEGEQQLVLSEVPFSQDNKAEFEAALADLKASYASFGAAVMLRVKSEAEGSASVAIERTDRSAATLAFLIRNGIGGSSQELQQLYDWVSDPTNLPKGTSWIGAALKRGATRGVIERELERKRIAFYSLVEGLARSGSLTPGYDRLKSSIDFIAAME
jgi:hypothetical protein